MSYKSYAQGGQYSTYHIDIPIKAEINEDLRAAGDFTKQMERSQKYREKWATSYLAALNDKSKIERQNRDDNFEFAQNNYKRIYEGEQREFDGRLAELKREQAEAANAEPGILEKLAPLLLQGAKLAAGMLAETAAAEHTAKLENIDRVSDAFSRNGMGNIGTVQRDFLSLDENAQVARAQEWGDKFGIAPEVIQNVLNSSGKYQDALNGIAGRQAAMAVGPVMDGLTQAGGDLHFSAKSREEWQLAFRQRQMSEIYKKMGGGDIEIGKKHFNELSTNQRDAVLKELGKHEQQLYRLQDKGWREGAITTELSYNINQTHDAINHSEGAGVGLYQLEQVFRQQFAHKDGGGSYEALERTLELIDKTPTSKSSHVKEYQQKRRLETGNIKGGGLLDDMITEKIKEMEKAEQDEMHNQTVRADRASKGVLRQVELGILNAESNRDATNLAVQVTQDPDFPQMSPEVQRKIKGYASGVGIDALRNPSVEKKMGLPLVSQNNGVKEGLERILSYESSAYKDLKNEEVAISQIRLGAQVKFMDDVWRKNQSSAALANPEMLWRVAVNETIKEQRNDGSLSFKNMKADGTPQNPAKPMTTHLAGGDYTSSAPHGTLQFNRVKTAVDQQGIGVLEDILFEIDPGSLTTSLTTYGTLINKMRANGEEIERRHLQGLLGSRAIREGAKAAKVDAAVYLDMQGKAHEKKTGIKWPGLGSKVRFEKEDKLRNSKLVDRMFQGYNVPTEASNYITSGQPIQMSPYVISRDAGNPNFLENRGTHLHAGEDTNTPFRTPIVAVRDGVVVDAGFTGTAAGGEIFIDNGGGYDSRALHMNEIVVQPGQRITPGTLLGYSGGEVGTKGAGRSTGPHGHWEIRKNGKLLNPMTKDENGILLDQFFGYGAGQ